MGRWKGVAYESEVEREWPAFLDMAVGQLRQNENLKRRRQKSTAVEAI